MGLRRTMRHWTCPSCGRQFTESASYSGDSDSAKSATGTKLAGSLLEKKQLHQQLGCKNDKQKACFLTTACVRARGLPDDCHELTALRAFRDEVLLATPAGRDLVQSYYALAPEVVARIDAQPDAARRWAELYGRLVRPTVALVEAGRHRAATEHYRREVERLLR